MGWCAEFGPQIKAGCSHPMAADEGACVCMTCGAICEGRFQGCAAVWTNGPVELHVVRPPEAAPTPDPAPAPQAPHATPPPAAPPPTAVPVPATDRVAVFLTTLDGVRTELRSLAQKVERQHELLTAAENRQGAIENALDILDHIPARVSAAIRGALAEAATVRTPAVAAGERPSQPLEAGETELPVPHSGPDAPPEPDPRVVGTA